LIVKVALPDPGAAKLEDEKTAVIPAGMPITFREMAALKVLFGAAVTTVDPALPAEILNAVVLVLNAKEGAGRIVRVIVALEVIPLMVAFTLTE